MKTYRLNANLMGLKYGDTFTSDDDKGWAPLVKNRLLTIEGEPDVDRNPREQSSSGEASVGATGPEDAAVGGTGGEPSEGELPGGDGKTEELNQGDSDTGGEGEVPVDKGRKRRAVRGGS